jgi:hypothetical protein
MQRLQILLIVSVAAAATGCAADRSTGFADAIEQAHNADAWYAHEAFRTSLDVDFGGSQVFSGDVLFTPAVGHVRMERRDGMTAVFDGERAWIAPPDAEFPRARFHLLTWPYFVAAPFKLSDPGTQLTPLPDQPLWDEPMERAKLTFAPGTGDSPDDWYVLYRDPQTDRLRAMAYIVTYNRPATEAEQSPHAAVFEQYAEVDGALVPTHMRFYHWSEEQGVHGEPIGEVKLTDPQFVAAPLHAFARPTRAREDKLPQ